MKDDRVFIRHILDEVNFIIRESENLEFEDLMTDEVMKRAIIKSLEIIGEATKNLSISFREKYTNITWKELAGLRNKLVHHYFGVDWEIIWDVVKNRLPEIKGKVEKMIEENIGTNEI